jgi:predicted GNAT family acetyltransferase
MTNETKQTVVDKIVALLNKEGFAPVLTQEEIKSFKEMEKEQIIDACWAGGDDGERYYNETYGGNK